MLYWKNMPVGTASLVGQGGEGGREGGRDGGMSTCKYLTRSSLPPSLPSSISDTYTSRVWALTTASAFFLAFSMLSLLC